MIQNQKDLEEGLIESKPQKWREGRKEENFLNNQFFGKFRFLFSLIEFMVIKTTNYKVKVLL